MGQQAVAVSQQDWMEERAALEVLADIRLPGQAVITQQISSVIWPHYSNTELDFNYQTSTMGGAVPLGLGVALAQPQREFLIITGEGAMLMHLGAMVSVAASGASNVTLLVIDNRMYEGTGGQQTPSALADVDFAGMAQSAGFASVASHWDLDEWKRLGPQELTAPGPRFICLQVQPCESKPPTPEAITGRALSDRALDFSKALTG